MPDHCGAHPRFQNTSSTLLHESFKGVLVPVRTRPLLSVFAARGLANYFVIFRELGRRTNHLSDVEIGGSQLETQLVESHPGFRVHLRVVNRHGELQRVMIGAVEPLFNTQIAAVRTASSIDPRSLIRSRGLHDKSIFIRPLSYRI